MELNSVLFEGTVTGIGDGYLVVCNRGMDGNTTVVVTLSDVLNEKSKGTLSVGMVVRVVGRLVFSENICLCIECDSHLEYRGDV